MNYNNKKLEARLSKCAVSFLFPQENTQTKKKDRNNQTKKKKVNCAIRYNQYTSFIWMVTLYVRFHPPSKFQNESQQ